MPRPGPKTPAVRLTEAEREALTEAYCKTGDVGQAATLAGVKRTSDAAAFLLSPEGEDAVRKAHRRAGLSEALVDRTLVNILTDPDATHDSLVKASKVAYDRLKLKNPAEQRTRTRYDELPAEEFTRLLIEAGYPVHENAKLLVVGIIPPPKVEVDLRITGADATAAAAAGPVIIDAESSPG